MQRYAQRLAGWAPRNEAEERAFQEVREELAFHPCEFAEQLSAAEHGARRDAKRVLSRLTGDHPERETACWREAPWGLLRARGEGNGLADFLGEVKAQLVPLIVGKRA